METLGHGRRRDSGGVFLRICMCLDFWPHQSKFHFMERFGLEGVFLHRTAKGFFSPLHREGYPDDGGIVAMAFASLPPGPQCPNTFRGSPFERFFSRFGCCCICWKDESSFQRFGVDARLGECLESVRQKKSIIFQLWRSKGSRP